MVDKFYLAQKVKELRKEKGYTQEYLANKLNAAQTYISSVEKMNINISLDKFDEIFEALGSSLEAHLNQDEVKKEKINELIAKMEALLIEMRRLL